MTNKQLSSSQGSGAVAKNTTEDKAGLELEKRQHTILERLSRLQHEVNQLAGPAEPATKSCSKPVSSSAAPEASSMPLAKTPNTEAFPSTGLLDVVINANPANPPLSVVVLTEMLAEQVKLMRSCHTHSSAVAMTPEKLKSFGDLNGSVSDRNKYQAAITLIWKDVKHGTNMMVSPRVQTLVEGESNVARYLARLLNPAYDSTDAVTATNIDQWLDQASQFVSGSNKERTAVLRSVNAQLGKAQWLVGGQLSLADIVLWSAIQQTGQADSVPGNVKKWIQTCNNTKLFKNALQLV